ncbi:hypothetical protein ABPG72_004299 [Tetrahymena utriculariae]
MKASKHINNNYFSIVDQLREYENHLKRVQNAQQKIFQTSKEHEVEKYQKYKQNYYRTRIHEENIKIQDMNKKNDLIMQRLLKIQNSSLQPQVYQPKKRSQSIQYSSEISKKNTENLLKNRYRQQLDIQRENVAIHSRLNSQKSIVDIYDIKNHEKKHKEFKQKLTKLDHDKQIKLRDVLENQFHLQSSKSIAFYLPLIQQNRNKSQINDSQYDTTHSKSQKKLRSISQTYDTKYYLDQSSKDNLLKSGDNSYYQPDYKGDQQFSESSSKIKKQQTQY